MLRGRLREVVYRKKRPPDSRSEQGFPAANRPMPGKRGGLGQVAPSTQMDGNRLTRSYNPRGQRKRRRRDGGLQATKPLQLSCNRAAGSGVQFSVRRVEDNCCIALIF